MTLGWILMLATAGADPGLEVERGRVIFDQGRFLDARASASRALAEAPANPEAQQLYLDASASAGLGARAIVELAAAERGVVSHAGAADALLEAVRADDRKAIKAALAALQAQHPDRPDALEALWSGSATVAQLGRTAALKRLKAKAMAELDVPGLYRLRRLVITHVAPADRAGVTPSKQDPRATVEAELAKRGEDGLPPRPPLTRVERTQLARTLVRDEAPELPRWYPAEEMDVATRLGALLTQARRYTDVVALYESVQPQVDDPTAWTQEAHAWVAAGEPARAIEAATEALVVATGPRRTDALVQDRDLRFPDVAQAFLARARAHDAAKDAQSALADLAMAHLFAGDMLDDKLAERLDDTMVGMVDLVRKRYPRRGAAWKAALHASQSTKDLSEARARLDDALFLATADTRGSRVVADNPRLYRDILAPLLAERGLVAALGGDLDAAGASSVLATMLLGDAAPGEWWRQRAEAHEALREVDAAFAAFARARALGVEDLDADLARTFAGLGPWEAAAAVHGPPVSAGALEVGFGERWPRVDGAFPDFTASTPQGDPLATAELRGTAVMVTFFTARCDACLRRLPRLASLAGSLRRTNHAAVSIAVSLDDDAAEFERVRAVGEHWGTLVHAPELRGRYGVDQEPVTVLVDRGGIARLVVGPGDALFQLEGVIRSLW